jgi:hypothetical protein
MTDIIEATLNAALSESLVMDDQKEFSSLAGVRRHDEFFA